MGGGVVALGETPYECLSSVIGWIQALGDFGFFKRLVELILFGQDDGQVQMGRRVIRLDRDCLMEGIDRAGVFAESPQAVAHVEWAMAKSGFLSIARRYQRAAAASLVRLEDNLRRAECGLLAIPIDVAPDFESFVVS